MARKKEKTVRMWIARDKLSYELYLFTEKPLLCEGDYWCPDLRRDYIEDDDYLQLEDEMFPEVTFDNSPQLVEIKLVNNL
jgi:hypothetical protein